MPKRRAQESPKGDNGDRAHRIAGLVARVISRAVHDAILADDLARTRKGQEVVADALLEFARVLDRSHVRGIGDLIEASNLARHATELLREGGM